MRDHLHFRELLFEFKASGPPGIAEAIVITLFIFLLVRGAWL